MELTFLTMEGNSMGTLSSIRTKVKTIKRLVDMAHLQLDLQGQEGIPQAESNLTDALDRLETLMLEDF